MKLFFGLIVGLVAINADATSCAILRAPKVDRRIICDITSGLFTHIRIGLMDRAICTSKGKGVVFMSFIKDNEFYMRSSEVLESASPEVNVNRESIEIRWIGTISGGLGSDINNFGTLGTQVMVPGTQTSFRVSCGPGVNF